MATNLLTIIIPVLAVFGTFMLALGYAQWATRDIEVYRAIDK